MDNAKFERFVVANLNAVLGVLFTVVLIVAVTLILVLTFGASTKEAEIILLGEAAVISAYNLFG